MKVLGTGTSRERGQEFDENKEKLFVYVIASHPPGLLLRFARRSRLGLVTAWKCLGLGGPGLSLLCISSRASYVA